MIRNFGVHQYDGKDGRSDEDVHAEREAEKEWHALKKSATLDQVLLEYLWADPRFKGAPFTPNHTPRPLFTPLAPLRLMQASPACPAYPACPHRHWACHAHAQITRASCCG